MTYAILYAVRSVEDPSKWRSRHESYSKGNSFQHAQMWSNPKTAAKEARYQEERRALTDQWVADGIHKTNGYMGACVVVELRIKEPE